MTFGFQAGSYPMTDNSNMHGTAADGHIMCHAWLFRGDDGDVYIKHSKTIHIQKHHHKNKNLLLIQMLITKLKDYALNNIS